MNNIHYVRIEGHDNLDRPYVFGRKARKDRFKKLRCFGLNKRSRRLLQQIQPFSLTLRKVNGMHCFAIINFFQVFDTKVQEHYSNLVHFLEVWNKTWTNLVLNTKYLNRTRYCLGSSSSLFSQIFLGKVNVDLTSKPYLVLVLQIILLASFQKHRTRLILQPCLQHGQHTV